MASASTWPGTSLASLPRRFGAKATKCRTCWKKGGIAKGTLTATFVNSRYQNLRQGNHAALFIRQVPGGIEIFDQWRNHKPSARVIHFGRSAAGASNRSELYSVVE